MEAAGRSSTVNIFNEAMMARQQAAKERAANRGPWDWTSRLRGGGGWGDVNRALAAQRAASEAADMAELEKQIQLGMGKEQALRDIGKTSITAATSAATSAEEAKRNAATNQAKVIGDRLNALGIDTTNKLKADIANVEAALKREANDISRMNFEDMSETRKLGILGDISKGIATLAQKYDAALAKELEGLSLTKGLKGKALQEEEKRITASWNLAKTEALKDLTRLERNLRMSVTGGTGGKTVVGSRAE